MDNQTFSGKLFTYKWEDLPQEDREIVEEAISQLALSYSPYSGFQVGAGVKLSDGSILGGSNQENASYPLCMCAERVALYTYSSVKRDAKIKSIAITAKNKEGLIDRAVFPCGACRQVIFEYERRQKSPIRILIHMRNGETLVTESAASILPFAFDESFLTSP